MKLKKLRILSMFSVILCIFATLLFYGCSSEEPAPAPVPISPEPVPVVEPTPSTSPEPTQTIKPVQAIDPQVDVLLKKSEKLTSYQYMDGQSNDIYFIKDNKVKIKIKDWHGSIGDYYDYVYLDTDEKKAFSVCLELTTCEKGKEQYSVLPYDKYKFKTPLEYLDEAKTGKVISSEKCEKYTCQVIQYEKEGKLFRMLITDYRGVPYEIREQASLGNYETILKFSDQAYDHLTVIDVSLPEGWTPK